MKYSRIQPLSDTIPPHESEAGGSELIRRPPDFGYISFACANLKEFGRIGIITTDTLEQLRSIEEHSPEKFIKAIAKGIEFEMQYISDMYKQIPDTFARIIHDLSSLPEVVWENTSDWKGVYKNFILKKTEHKPAFSFNFNRLKARFYAFADKVFSFGQGDINRMVDDAINSALSGSREVSANSNSEYKIDLYSLVQYHLQTGDFPSFLPKPAEFAVKSVMQIMDELAGEGLVLIKNTKTRETSTVVFRNGVLYKGNKVVFLSEENIAKLVKELYFSSHNETEPANRPIDSYKQSVVNWIKRQYGNLDPSIFLRKDWETVVDNIVNGKVSSEDVVNTLLRRAGIQIKSALRLAGDASQAAEQGKLSRLEFLQLRAEFLAFKNIVLQTVSDLLVNWMSPDFNFKNFSKQARNLRLAMIKQKKMLFGNKNFTHQVKHIVSKSEFEYLEEMINAMSDIHIANDDKRYFYIHQIERITSQIYTLREIKSLKRDVIRYLVIRYLQSSSQQEGGIMTNPQVELMSVKQDIQFLHRILSDVSRSVLDLKLCILNNLCNVRIINSNLIEFELDQEVCNAVREVRNVKNKLNGNVSKFQNNPELERYVKMKLDQLKVLENLISPLANRNNGDKIIISRQRIEHIISRISSIAGVDLGLVLESALNSRALELSYDAYREAVETVNSVTRFLSIGGLDDRRLIKAEAHKDTIANIANLHDISRTVVDFNTLKVEIIPQEREVISYIEEEVKSISNSATIDSIAKNIEENLNHNPTSSPQTIIEIVLMDLQSRLSQLFSLQQKIENILNKYSTHKYLIQEIESTAGKIEEMMGRIQHFREILYRTLTVRKLLWESGIQVVGENGQEITLKEEITSILNGKLLGEAFYEPQNNGGREEPSRLDKNLIRSLVLLMLVQIIGAGPALAGGEQPKSKAGTSDFAKFMNFMEKGDLPPNIGLTGLTPEQRKEFIKLLQSLFKEGELPEYMVNRIEAYIAHLKKEGTVPLEFIENVEGMLALTSGKGMEYINKVQAEKLYRGIRQVASPKWLIEYIGRYAKVYGFNLQERLEELSKNPETSDLFRQKDGKIISSGKVATVKQYFIIFGDYISADYNELQRRYGKEFEEISSSNSQQAYRELARMIVEMEDREYIETTKVEINGEVFSYRELNQMGYGTYVYFILALDKLKRLMRGPAYFSQKGSISPEWPLLYEQTGERSILLFVNKSIDKMVEYAQALFPAFETLWSLNEEAFQKAIKSAKNKTLSYFMDKTLPVKGSDPKYVVFNIFSRFLLGALIEVSPYPLTEFKYPSFNIEGEKVPTILRKGRPEFSVQALIGFGSGIGQIPDADITGPQAYEYLMRTKLPDVNIGNPLQEAKDTINETIKRVKKEGGEQLSHIVSEVGDRTRSNLSQFEQDLREYGKQIMDLLENLPDEDRKALKFFIENNLNVVQSKLEEGDFQAAQLVLLNILDQVRVAISQRSNELKTESTELISQKIAQLLNTLNIIENNLYRTIEETNRWYNEFYKELLDRLDRAKNVLDGQVANVPAYYDTLRNHLKAQWDYYREYSLYAILERVNKFVEEVEQKFPIEDLFAFNPKKGENPYYFPLGFKFRILYILPFNDPVWEELVKNYPHTDYRLIDINGDGIPDKTDIMSIPTFIRFYRQYLERMKAQGKTPVPFEELIRGIYATYVPQYDWYRKANKNIPYYITMLNTPDGKKIYQISSGEPFYGGFKPEEAEAEFPDKNDRMGWPQFTLTFAEPQKKKLENGSIEYNFPFLSLGIKGYEVKFERVKIVSTKDDIFNWKNISSNERSSTIFYEIGGKKIDLATNSQDFVKKALAHLFPPDVEVEVGGLSLQVPDGSYANLGGVYYNGSRDIFSFKDFQLYLTPSAGAEVLTDTTKIGMRGFEITPDSLKLDKFYFEFGNVLRVGIYELYKEKNYTTLAELRVFFDKKFEGYLSDLEAVYGPNSIYVALAKAQVEYLKNEVFFAYFQKFEITDKNDETYIDLKRAVVVTDNWEVFGKDLEFEAHRRNYFRLQASFAFRDLRNYLSSDGAAERFKYYLENSSETDPKERYQKALDRVIDEYFEFTGMIGMEIGNDAYMAYLREVFIKNFKELVYANIEEMLLQKGGDISEKDIQYALRISAEVFFSQGEGKYLYNIIKGLEVGLGGMGFVLGTELAYVQKFRDLTLNAHNMTPREISDSVRDINNGIEAELWSFQLMYKRTGDFIIYFACMRLLRYKEIVDAWLRNFEAKYVRGEVTVAAGMGHLDYRDEVKTLVSNIQGFRLSTNLFSKDFEFNVDMFTLVKAMEEGRMMYMQALLNEIRGKDLRNIDYGDIERRARAMAFKGLKIKYNNGFILELAEANMINWGKVFAVKMEELYLGLNTRKGQFSLSFEELEFLIRNGNWFRIQGFDFDINWKSREIHFAINQTEVEVEKKALEASFIGFLFTLSKNKEAQMSISGLKGMFRKWMLVYLENFGFSADEDSIYKVYLNYFVLEALFNKFVVYLEEKGFIYDNKHNKQVDLKKLLVLVFKGDVSELDKDFEEWFDREMDNILFAFGIEGYSSKGKEEGVRKSLDNFGVKIGNIFELLITGAVQNKTPQEAHYYVENMKLGLHNFLEILASGYYKNYTRYKKERGLEFLEFALFHRFITGTLENIFENIEYKVDEEGKVIGFNIKQGTGKTDLNIGDVVEISWNEYKKEIDSLRGIKDESFAGVIVQISDEFRAAVDEARRVTEYDGKTRKDKITISNFMFYFGELIDARVKEIKREIITKEGDKESTYTKLTIIDAYISFLKGKLMGLLSGEFEYNKNDGKTDYSLIGKLEFALKNFEMWLQDSYAKFLASGKLEEALINFYIQSKGIDLTTVFNYKDGEYGYIKSRLELRKWLRLGAVVGFKVYKEENKVHYFISLPSEFDQSTLSEERLKSLITVEIQGTDRVVDVIRIIGRSNNLLEFLEELKKEAGDGNKIKININVSYLPYLFSVDLPPKYINRDSGEDISSNEVSVSGAVTNLDTSESVPNPDYETAQRYIFIQSILRILEKFSEDGMIYSNISFDIDELQKLVDSFDLRNPNSRRKAIFILFEKLTGASVAQYSDRVLDMIEGSVYGMYEQLWGNYVKKERFSVSGINTKDIPQLGPVGSISGSTQGISFGYHPEDSPFEGRLAYLRGRYETAVSLGPTFRDVVDPNNLPVVFKNDLVIQSLIFSGRGTLISSDGTKFYISVAGGHNWMSLEQGALLAALINPDKSRGEVISIPIKITDENGKTVAFYAGMFEIGLEKKGKKYEFSFKFKGGTGGKVKESPNRRLTIGPDTYYNLLTSLECNLSDRINARLGLGLSPLGTRQEIYGNFGPLTLGFRKTIFNSPGVRVGGSSMNEILFGMKLGIGELSVTRSSLGGGYPTAYRFNLRAAIDGLLNQNKN